MAHVRKSYSMDKEEARDRIVADVKEWRKNGNQDNFLGAVQSYL